MEEKRNISEIPPEGIETLHGRLYPPPKLGIQILFFVASFLTAIFLGWFISTIAGSLSVLAKGFIYFIYIIIFILGYASWASLTSVIVFKAIKMPIIKTMYRYFVRKEKPASLIELLPTREEAAALIVRTQKATRIFFIMSLPIGIIGGLLSLFIKTSINSTILFALIIMTAVIFGFLLSYFGRRGYLPFPVE